MTLPWTVPVMQAPVGPAATPELAAAVSEAGGLGSLGASWTEPARLREQIRAIRRVTDRPFAVNLVLAFDQEERLELLCEEGVPIVSFSWGVEPELVERAHAAGCLVIAQAGEVGEGQAAVEAGADALIAQGVEAGGHVQGTTPLLDLVTWLSGDVPVIAAGGIVDADGLREAQAAGAEGVVMGTRFLATPEADVHAEYADRLLAAGAGDTVLTYLFDGGWPGAAHRVLRNTTYRVWEEAGRPASGARPNEGEIVAETDGEPIARYAADEPHRSTTGEIEAMCLYAGRGVGRITTVEPAAEIVARIVS
jgi:NAD(P)H-dependent flavin oxidoreductase YrpB (nitropropane dioxygenase family)